MQHELRQVQLGLCLCLLQKSWPEPEGIQQTHVFSSLVSELDGWGRKRGLQVGVAAMVPGQTLAKAVEKFHGSQKRTVAKVSIIHVWKYYSAIIVILFHDAGCTLGPLSPWKLVLLCWVWRNLNLYQSSTDSVWKITFCWRDNMDTKSMIP